MSKYHSFNSEKNIKYKLPNEITLFWNKGLFDSFIGIDKVNIHYAQFIQEQVECPTIVIVPGRCESYLKYQELSFDLYQQGYNIFIIDHRGQGLSGRMLLNVNKGYVTKFQDYVDDLRYFIENIVTPKSSEKPYLLAHSMGGTIATRFMQDSPNAIKAAVISSPMLGFYSGLLPKSIAKILVAIKLKFNNIISNTPWYFLGQKDYSPVNFTDNKLTHSIPRYQYFVDLYKKNKIIQLGGVTTHWLAQSIAAQKELFSKIVQLKTPILLLQASGDTVVCQQAQDDFCQQLHTLQPQSCPNGVPSNIDNAFHELFFETDDLRNKAITQSLAWFEQHT
ncbi:alpha/beta fold hydrolase [Colwellia psychrerythraea]|uniref:Lysophospholipase L2 n=1 Tax=Colwellia psychrerythraea (strain 34H / ATCC BAA-681) TaxID=167879 RepID=Q47VY9_COLP3|nr:alpha/beta fold hydrolase [Colwellia psychrerythraea]AAZ25471.1 lysophospholipase L2 [Colwellia psychrerythraea 34H]